MRGFPLVEKILVVRIVQRVEFVLGADAAVQRLIRYNKLRKFQNRRNENSPQNKGQGQRHLVE